MLIEWPGRAVTAAVLQSPPYSVPGCVTHTKPGTPPKVPEPNTRYPVPISAAMIMSPPKNLDADPDVMRYVTGGIPTSREEIQDEFLPAFLDYYQRYEGYGFWAAIEKATGEFLGWFHFRPGPDAAPGEVELGYRLRKSAWA